MNILKMSFMVTLLFSAVAGATNQTDPTLDLSGLASNTLKLDGIASTRIVEVVEAGKPFVFTYCRKDSSGLWRHEVMTDGQPDTWSVLRITKDQAMESTNELCKEKT